jgi:hypothetical protein
MIWNMIRRAILVAVIVGSIGTLPESSRAVLYVYEPFNYTAGDNLGGTDPDGAGPTAGTPVGKSGSYTADFGGGTSYTWYARGTISNYQSPKDGVVSAGNLSYPGLAASTGNSVSYGSGLSNPANDTFNKSLYADTFALPTSVSSGSLYASFIIRIKSEVENGTAATDRHSPVALVPDLTHSGNAGAALAGQSGTGVAANGLSFWMRRDPDDVNLTTSNFSPGKSSSDGIGPGADGNSSGWQRSVSGGGNTESNQFGDIDGQPEAVFADSNTWQTYFVVLKYEFDAQASTNGQVDTVSMWMNPGSGTLGTATGETDASQAPTGNLGSYYGAVGAFGTATSDSASINSFALIGHRQNTNETIAVDFDELRIGTTWQDVTPAAGATVPGDWNGDTRFNAADYPTWRKSPNDFDGDPTGYEEWRANFGNPPANANGLENVSVPEPSALVLLVIASASLCGRRRSSR